MTGRFQPGKNAEVRFDAAKIERGERAESKVCDAGFGILSGTFAARLGVDVSRAVTRICVKTIPSERLLSVYREKIRWPNSAWAETTWFRPQKVACPVNVNRASLTMPNLSNSF